MSELLLRNHANGFEIPVTQSAEEVEFSKGHPGFIYVSILGDGEQTRVFTEHHWELVRPKLTAAEFVATLIVGDRFTATDSDGNQAWPGVEYIIYLGPDTQDGVDGKMIKGVRYGKDNQPRSLWLKDTDVLNRVI